MVVVTLDVSKVLEGEVDGFVGDARIERFQFYPSLGQCSSFGPLLDL